jgi:hypothetical protein
MADATAHSKAPARPTGAKQQAQFFRGQLEVRLQLRRCDRQIDPVDVVDQHANAEQYSDRPTSSGEALRVWCHFGSFPLPDAIFDVCLAVLCIADKPDLANWQRFRWSDVD